MTVRKRSTSLTLEEQGRYRSVITGLISSGEYAQFVAWHRESHHQHSSMSGMDMGGGAGRMRFLSWHRAFLLHVESAMQARDPVAFIPFWDWTTEQQVPEWMVDFTPTVNVPVIGPVHVERTPGQLYPHLPTPHVLQTILDDSPTYTQFTRRLEMGPHGEVHEWVGGPMALIDRSPADPLFLLHHSNIDRLWSQWQALHPGAGPVLHGADATMDPWTDTATSLASISALGYSYGP